jgi:type IV pilus assembly protein PilA
VPDLPKRATDERGFTLIELLVVILVLGVLTAIAIPSFLNQTGKAYDASAKELAHDAQIAAETYATDNNGSWAQMAPLTLQHYESAIAISAAAGTAYVSSASGTATGYTVTIRPAGGNETFSINRNGGMVTRTCTPTSGIAGGCDNGSW